MKIYIAKEGDNFWKIAEDNGIDMDILIQVNPQIAKPEMMLPGMKIKIPQKRKHVKNDFKKEFKKKANNQNTEHDFIKDMRQLLVMQEDDTWENVQPALPESVVIEKKKYPLRSETEHKSNKLVKNKQPKQVPTKNTTAYLNPISVIRNMPRENIPEVSLLQMIP